MNPFRNLVRHHTERKLFFLFLSLVALLVVYPFFENDFLKSPVMISLLTGTLSLAMKEMENGGTQFLVALGLGIPAIIFSWIPVIVGYSDVVVAASYAFSLALYSFSSWAILRHIFRDHKVESDAVYGAISVYFLLGIIWASMFSLIGYFNPNAFTGMSGSVNLMWSDMLYYSYSTLSTLGIGDIMPVSELAKALTSLEAVVGVMYIAVLVSRFIGYSENRGIL